MTEELTKRKLTAILSADIKGYSRLMGDDEESTVRTITAYREVMTGLIEGQNGRVIDAKGDNLLAEFPSVVDAVRCSVVIQKELKVRNDELTENRKMKFRIGINLGDVIEERDTIYGNGVNIAARLENLADGGGICISRMAFDNVKNKLDVGFEYLGEHSVKNISEPVRVYKVLMEPEYAGKVIGEEGPKPKMLRWATTALAVLLFVVSGAFTAWHFYFRSPPIEPASVEKMAFDLPEKPSLAILPFVNMSGDPKQEHLSDGITESLITAVSRIHNLFVIARNSTFTYKGKAVKVQQVAEDLGVQYVLEGSVQRSGDRLRITAQLIDALSGRNVWSERYDRELKDLYSLQDDITMEVLTAMRVKLTEGAQVLRAKRPINIEAAFKAYEAHGYLLQFSPEANAMGKKLSEEVVAMDPSWGEGYYVLIEAHMMDVWLGTTKSPKESIARAIELSEKAISLDDSLAQALGLLGYLYGMKREYDKSVAYAEKAVEKDPNGADANAWLGNCLNFAAMPKEAIPHYKKAMRLNPRPQLWYYIQLGQSYRMMGRYEESVAQLKKSLALSPNSFSSYVHLIFTYMEMGKEDEARAAASELIRINPKFSVEKYAKALPYKDRGYCRRWGEALRKAFLPEKPPLQLPDKPSIAVLPFNNMSVDPEQEYFSDGLTEEIITALSKITKLFVIARHSSFSYKGKPVKVKQVSEELGVRYVLEGSVRKAEDRVRITAQLIDALSGHHLWAERYERDLKDIFALQDEITMKVINALQVELTEGEHARLWAKGTDNLEAYLKSLHARELYLIQTKENNELARRTAEEAIALDPEYAPPYHVLSVTHFMDIFFKTTQSPQQSMKQAVELIQKAIALDDSYALAHGWLGNLYTWLRKYEEAIMEAQKCVALDPNGAHGYLYLCIVYRFAGRFEEAVQAIEKAIRLNPFPPNMYYREACKTYFFVGRYEEAIAAGKKAVKLSPNDRIARSGLVTAYSLAGRQEEARIEAEEILRLNPKYSVVRVGKLSPFKNQADRELIINALRKAGLPE